MLDRNVLLEYWSCVDTLAKCGPVQRLRCGLLQSDNSDTSIGCLAGNVEEPAARECGASPPGVAQRGCLSIWLWLERSLKRNKTDCGLASKSRRTHT